MMDEIDRAIQRESTRLDSPLEHEDNEFLNDIDGGYIGHSQPVVRFTPDPYGGIPGWVIHKFEKLARNEGLTLEQYVEKYDPVLEPSDWDNDPGSPEQAYA